MLDVRAITEDGWVVFCPDCESEHGCKIQTTFHKKTMPGKAFRIFIKRHEGCGGAFLAKIESEMAKVDENWVLQLIYENPKLTFKQIRELYEKNENPLLRKPKLPQRHPLIEEALRIFPGAVVREKKL